MPPSPIRHRTPRLWAFIVFAFCISHFPFPSLLQSAPPLPPTLPAAHASSLQADFLCQKQLPQLDTILQSQGTLTLETPDHLRLSTTSPYQSDIIIIAGKILAKSQHESTWTQTPFPPRLGLTALMTHLASAALGNPGGGGVVAPLANFYTISPISEPIPTPLQHSEFSIQNSQMFLLTLSNKDLQKSIQDLRLAFDSRTHILIFAQITMRQGDVIRYWFSNIRLNPTLPPDTFAPATSH